MTGGVGMEAGLARKSGNTDGVKASTVTARARTNIHHTQRWKTNGKRPHAYRTDATSVPKVAEEPYAGKATCTVL